MTENEEKVIRAAIAVDAHRRIPAEKATPKWDRRYQDLLGELSEAVYELRGAQEGEAR